MFADYEDGLRELAEWRMDECSRATVRRLTGDTTPNPVTGYDDPEWAPVHTDLPFRLVPKGSRAVTVGGVEYEQATARGDMPADTTDLADGDLIVLTAGEWAGTVLSIVEAVKGDQRTARRVPVVEVQAPEEWA